jgi:two-component system response regulator HydG
VTDSRNILLVDDDASVRRLLGHWLTHEGYVVEGCGSVAEAREAVRASLPDVIFLDVQLPDGSGMNLLPELHSAHPQVPIVMLTGDSEVERVVTAMQEGAYDFLPKPVSRTRVVTTARNALDKATTSLEVTSLQREVKTGGHPSILGQSPVMRVLFRQMDRVAMRDITVLITGESGTGKELVARGLHDGSTRSTGPFVAVNCASIAATLQESELFGHEKGSFTGADDRRHGRFEQANSGTLFLDEVAELSPSLQAALLRVLQERTLYRVGGSRQVSVDVRVVAATHRDLRAMVSEGTFREDLYYRLAVVELQVPALRERGADIALLADAFVLTSAAKHGCEIAGLSSAARAVLTSYDWPGNVRELQNAMERGVILAAESVLDVGDLPPVLAAAAEEMPAPTAAESAEASTLHDLEKQAILDAIERCNGNLSEVTRLLGVPRSTLYRRLRAYGLK